MTAPATLPSNHQEEKLLQHMLGQLSGEEMETAARASYEYQAKLDDVGDSVCTTNPAGTQCREHHARKMAQRYLRSKSNDAEKALRKMKDTLAFRQRVKVDELVTAFDDVNNDNHKPLKEHLQSEMLYVSGFDKQGRSTFVFVPRKVQHHDADWTIKQHVYTLERAIACSKAEDKEVSTGQRGQ